MRWNASSSVAKSLTAADRKSVVKGKSVDLGGRRIIKKKKRQSPLYFSQEAVLSRGSAERRQNGRTAHVSRLRFGCWWALRPERRQTPLFFFFQAEDGIRDGRVTGVQTCALPISRRTCAVADHTPRSRAWRDDST